MRGLFGQKLQKTSIAQAVGIAIALRSIAARRNPMGPGGMSERLRDYHVHADVKQTSLNTDFYAKMGGFLSCCAGLLSSW